MDVNDPTYRSDVMRAYRGHIMRSIGVNVPDVTSSEDLLAVARKCIHPPIEAEQGWHSDPPFPGAAERPEKMPNGWRMICATRVLDSNNTVLGTLFMTFFTGRRVAVVFNLGDGHIPAEYKPLFSTR